MHNFARKTKNRFIPKRKNLQNMSKYGIIIFMLLENKGQGKQLALLKIFRIKGSEDLFY